MESAKAQTTSHWSQRQNPQGPTKPPYDAISWTSPERSYVKGNLQLSHVLGNSFGQYPQPFVAATDHRVHAGTLGRTRRWQQAAAFIVTCRGRETK